MLYWPALAMAWVVLMSAMSNHQSSFISARRDQQHQPFRLLVRMDLFLPSKTDMTECQSPRHQEAEITQYTLHPWLYCVSPLASGQHFIGPSNLVTSLSRAALLYCLQAQGQDPHSVIS